MARKGLKVRLLEAEKAKRILSKQGLIDKALIPQREKGCLIIPVIDEEKARKILDEQGIKAEVVEQEFREKKRVRGLKEIVRKITGRDIGIGMDRVGDIIILHLDGELNEIEKKELGKELLKTYNVEKVYLKKSERKGPYRLEELECIAGRDESLTIHKENGYKLLVDVKKTYFSPRLGRDRETAMKIVEEGEDVMVLFSGIGPYVISTARKARISVGIELNPDAHILAKKNIEINRLRNAFVIHGDARNANLLVNQYFLGLKSHWEKKQLEKRLKHTRMIELHLKNGDLENHYKEIEKIIEELVAKDYRVMIHQPFMYKNKKVALSNLEEREVLEAYTLLEKLVEKGAMGYVAHPNPGHGGIIEKADEMLGRYGKKLRSMYIENLITDTSGEIEEIIRIAEKHGKNICIDTSHALLRGYNLKNLSTTINKFKGLIHLHVSNGRNGSIEYHGTMIKEEDLGEFQYFLENTRYYSGVIEVLNRDEENPIEALKTQESLYRGTVKKFDHVFMPLPKDSASFLSEALSIIRNNGLIHMYRFLGDNIQKEIEELEKVAEKKGYKLELLKAERVGEHSPGIWRWRLDIRTRRL
ncbi:hypothetical protein J7K74_03000 [Candidatus Woesearchaeota archaeon]|nr:hypothetical protein [Candidatus Woesearchaeota archaeon]